MVYEAGGNVRKLDRLLANLEGIIADTQDYSIHIEVYSDKFGVIAAIPQRISDKPLKKILKEHTGRKFPKTLRITITRDGRANSDLTDSVFAITNSLGIPLNDDVDNPLTEKSVFIKFP
jgi:hypothetical protein